MAAQTKQGPELQLVVTPAVEEQLRHEARRARDEGRERCGFLLGEKTTDAVRVYWITEPGPQATMIATHCEPDYALAAREKERLSAEYANVDFVGGWHIHLGYGSRLSGGDVRTLQRVAPQRPDFIALLVDIPSRGEMTFNAYRLSDQQAAPCPYHAESMTPKAWSDAERAVQAELASERFARTKGLVPHPVLAEKRVLVIGLGSGGSAVVKHLGRAGLFRWTLNDPEMLEEVNLSRHEGLPADVGQKKVDVMTGILKALSPSMQVTALDFDVRTDPARLRALVAEHDLVLACAGDPRVYALMNQMALDTGVPMVFAGVFPKAIGGYVLQVLPGQSACWNCLYDISQRATSLESNQTVRETSQRYGWSEDELRAQQGIYIDISFIALLQAKMALLTLLRGVRHDIGDWAGNLVLWNSHDLSIKAVQLERRTDCSACHPEGWTEKRWEDAEGPSIPWVESSRIHWYPGGQDPEPSAGG